MFEILDEVCTPKRGTKYSAYVDLFSREDYIIGAGETKVVKLGVKLDFDALINKLYEYAPMGKHFHIWKKEHLDFELKSHYLEVALRSSLGVKGLIIANGIGIIDLDYPDEIGLIVHNPINQTHFYDDGKLLVNNMPSHYLISKGDKVAQCTLKEHKGYLMGYETETERKGGFGSTGTK